MQSRRCTHIGVLARAQDAFGYYINSKKSTRRARYKSNLIKKKAAATRLILKRSMSATATRLIQKSRRHNERDSHLSVVQKIIGNDFLFIYITDQKSVRVLDLSDLLSEFNTRPGRPVCLIPRPT